jgi:hypothetical protein
MSTSTVRGTIKNFSPKPDEGYYGVLVNTGQSDKWLNGNGEIPDKLSKGDKVKIEANTNGFIEINDIEVVGSGSNSSGEGEGSSDMDAQRTGKGAATDHVSKQERIKVQTAFKKAVDQVDRRSCETESDYRKMVKDLTVIHIGVLDEVMGQ